MPTLIRVEGWEHRAISTLSFSGGAGQGIFDLINTSSAFSVDLTVARSGVASLKLIQDGVNACFAQIGFANTQVLVGSCYIRVTTAPTQGSRILRHPGPTESLKFLVTSGGILQAGFAYTGEQQSTPASIADGVFHRLDWRVLTDTTTHTVDWAVDGVAMTQASFAAGAAQNMTDLELGANQGFANATVWYDDLVISVTSGDYPIGPHSVFSLVPTSDGTHNAGANIMENQAGTDIGVVTAFDLIDEWPVEETDYIQQVAIGAGNYAEVNFADTSEDTILGVSAYAALRSAGANANSATTRVVDSGGATLVDVYTGTMAATTPNFRTAIVPDPGGGGWTQAELNGVKGRVGFGTDVDSVPWWLALMLQYASSPVPPGPLHRYVKSQAVHRASRW